MKDVAELKAQIEEQNKEIKNFKIEPEFYALEDPIMLAEVEE